jgi:23S rRNA (cytidine1920-2'-O)/16S rRNA (cytidine1409-2'-O)-methyltransferase
MVNDAANHRKPRKTRLDDAMVERGLAESRVRAQALILAGVVRLPAFPRAGKPFPGTLVPDSQEIVVRRGPRFVSRGGEKLAHALAVFGVDPAGMTALDVGASTGGFTDCLLQAGATRVYAVDVGRGQLHGRLVADPRVLAMEKVNARMPFDLPEKVDLLVADVSFISLRMVLGPSLAHLRPGARAVVLVKPQFEAETGEVGPRGVVHGPLTHAAVLGRVVRWAVERGIRVRSLTASPLLGDKGNREFFLLLEPGG